MVIPITIIIMMKDIAMPIHTSPKCLKLSRNFYCTSGMPLMKEWYMKCKIYMKTRMFIVKILLVHNCIIINCIIKVPKII